MTLQIAQGYPSDTAIRTEGEMAQFFEDTIDITKEMPGGNQKYGSVIQLSGDAFTPVKRFNFFELDVEGGVASSDNLATITPTNVRNGGIVGFHISNNSRAIVITQTGNIQLPDSNNITCNDNKYEYWFRYDSVIGKFRLHSITHELIRINRLPGAQSATILTIGNPNGDVTPTRGIHILAAFSGVTDNLDNITLTNLPYDQAPVGFKADTGDTITVRNQAGGTGNIRTASGADEILSGTRVMWFWREGANMVEVDVQSDNVNVPAAGICQARLSVSSTDKYGVSLGSSNVYLHPCNGNQIGIKDTATGKWVPRTLTGVLTKALPAGIARLYAIHAYWTGSAIDLEFEACDTSQVSGSITGISIATSAVVTATNTLSNGDYVMIVGGTGTVFSNGTNGLDGQLVTVSSVSGSAFTLAGWDTTGLAYTSGGTFYKVPRSMVNPVVLDSGVPVKGGDPSRRLIGFVLLDKTSGQTANAAGGDRKAFLCNIYNRSSLPLLIDIGGSTYNGGERVFNNQPRPARCHMVWPYVAEVTEAIDLRVDFKIQATNGGNARGLVTPRIHPSGASSGTGVDGSNPSLNAVPTFNLESEMFRSVVVLGPDHQNVITHGPNVLQLNQQTAGGANNVTFTRGGMIVHYPFF